MATQCLEMLSLRSQSYRHSLSDEGNSRALVRRTQLHQNIEPPLLLRKVADPLELEAFRPRKLVNACFGAQRVVLRTIMVVVSGGK